MTSKSTKIRSLLLLASLGLSVAAQAGDDYSKNSYKNAIVQKPSEPRFYASLSAGGEFDIHATKFISNGNADFGVAGLTTLPAKIQSRDFTATHDVGTINGRLELGYVINPYLNVFTGFTYSHANGDDGRRLGRVTDPAGLFGATGGVYNLYADVGEYEAFAGMAGFKLTLPRYILNLIHAPSIIQPYFSASAGGKYLNAQHVRFFSGGNRDLAGTNFELYDDSWVFTSEANLGYDIKFTKNFSVVFESGYGYDTKPDRGNNGGGSAVTTGVNNGGSRLYSTLSLGAKVSF